MRDFENLTKRVVIVDFNHLAHTYMNSQHRLTKTINDAMGNATVVDTTIPNGAIKSIHRWSQGGYFPVVVCLDSPVPTRKEYFEVAFDMKKGTDKEYKGGRVSMGSQLFSGIALTTELLTKANVCVVKGMNYEADDLVFECIRKAKQQYPGYAIDVVTNDADLLPLVDDTVSVFLRSRKFTSAIDKSILKNKYIQVTPDNYEETVSGLSAYKGFRVPYNSLLLHKLLRGDSSDNLGSKEISRKFPPKKYNALIEQMEADGVDFPTFCKYGETVYEAKDVNTGLPIAEFRADNANDWANKATLVLHPPLELGTLISVMSNYVEDDVLEHMRKMYIGMNLNQGYTSNLAGGTMKEQRMPACVKLEIKGYNDVELQSVVCSLGINLGLR